MLWIVYTYEYEDIFQVYQICLLEYEYIQCVWIACVWPGPSTVVPYVHISVWERVRVYMHTLRIARIVGVLPAYWGHLCTCMSVWENVCIYIYTLRGARITGIPSIFWKHVYVRVRVRVCVRVCVYITRSANSRHMACLLRASVSDCVNNKNERYVYINMNNYIDVCMYE